MDEPAVGPAGDARVLAAQATVSALLAGVGGWVDRAVDRDRLLEALGAGPREPSDAELGGAHGGHGVGGPGELHAGH